MELMTENDRKTSRIILAFVLASALVIGGLILLIMDVITNVPDFKDLKGAVEVTIKKPNGDKTTKIVGPKTKSWVPISQISNYALMAVIASEDSSFFSHDGVDYNELKEAIKKDWKEKRWARGASTITQQVIKNVYLTREKTLWRKFKEFIWAREMDKVMSKNEILNFYFNLVEFGPGIYGIKEAARYYFNALPSELTTRQGAFLAMLLPSPIKYSSYFRKKQLSEWATKRVNRILEIMAKMGFIDEVAYQNALTERLWDDEISPSGETQPADDEYVPFTDPIIHNEVPNADTPDTSDSAPPPSAVEESAPPKEEPPAEDPVSTEPPPAD